MKNIQRENKQTITALKTKKGKKEIRKRGTNKKKKKKKRKKKKKKKKKKQRDLSKTKAAKAVHKK